MQLAQKQIPFPARMTMVAFAKKLILPALALFIIPILPLLLKPIWLFSQFGLIDPWIYYGYFLETKKHLLTFPTTYYESRLPWIFLGSTIYHLFTPLVAKYMLYLVVTYTNVLSIYGILKRTVSIKAALIAVLFFSSYKFFLLSATSEYVDGMAQGFFLLALFFLTPSKGGSQPMYRYLFAGVSLSCLFISQLFLVVYIPLIALYFLFFHPSETLKSTLFSFIPILAGFFVTTFLFCLMNYLITGNFFFYTTVLKWTKQFSRSENPWWEPFSEWSFFLKHYIVYCFTALGSLISLFFYKVIAAHPRGKKVVFFQTLYILNVLIYLYFQFIKKQPILQLTYYSSYLNPLMFLSLASFASIGLTHLRKKTWFLLGVAIAGIVWFGVAPPKNIDQHLIAFQQQYWIFCILLGTLGYFSLMLLKQRWRIFGCLIFGFAFCLGNIDGYMNRNRNYSSEKNRFLSLNQTLDVVKKFSPEGNARFWYAGDDVVYSPIYRAIASTYLWGYRMVNENFPYIESTQGLSFPNLQDQSFFIFATDDNVLDLANQSLAKVDVQAELIAKERIMCGDIVFNLFFMKGSDNRRTRH